MLAVIIIELMLAAFGALAFKITHSASFWAIPIAVPAQFLVAACVVTVSVTSLPTQEALAIRQIRLRGIAIATTCAMVCIVMALITALLIGESGTIGRLAPMRTLMAMLGIGLLTARLLDRRLAGVAPVVLVVFPVVLDPRSVPGECAWGLAVAQDAAEVPWMISAGLLLLGIASLALPHEIVSRRLAR